MDRQLRNIALSLGLALAIVGCGSGRNQSPNAQEEVGQINAFEPEDKPSTYRSKQGDNLRKIAGRPEVYGDPELWPILAEANADRVGQGTRVNKGTVLAIPRDLSADQMAEAREKARAAAAVAKQAKAEPRPASKPAAKAPQAPAPVAKATAAPTPVPPAPVPAERKGGLLPLLLILLLVLVALAFVLWFFMKRDREEQKR